AAGEPVISEAVERDMPILAIGRGARLLAAVLGGAPAPGEGSGEPFVAPLHLTDEGCLDRVLGAAPSPVDVVCRDRAGFDLPPAATPLAWSPATPARAFRVRHAYGLPFHLEVDAEIAGRWSLALPAESTLRAALAVFAMFTRVARMVR